MVHLIANKFPMDGVLWPLPKHLFLDEINNIFSYQMPPYRKNYKLG
jgi:hypothetical protein